MLQATRGQVANMSLGDAQKQFAMLRSSNVCFNSILCRHSVDAGPDETYNSNGECAKEMDELIVSLTECTLCTESMNSPKFLPCFHCFCRKCIEKLCCVHEDTGTVPCPLCRATFSRPVGGSCRRLPTNVYAEELVRVSEVVKAANKEHLVVKDELEAVKIKLKASEDSRRQTLEEKRRQDIELAENRNELKDRSLQMEDLKRNVSDSKSRESVLREHQRHTLEQLATVESSYKAAKIEVESCQKAKMEAEASLAMTHESCQSLSEQLQLTRQETNEQANSLQTELGKSMREIDRLKDQLAIMKKQLNHVSALSGMPVLCSNATEEHSLERIPLLCRLSQQ